LNEKSRAHYHQGDHRVVTIIIAASIVTIFNTIEIEKLKWKQQKAEIMAKLSRMALKEISNSQTELIRLTSKIVGSLAKSWANMDTIQHVIVVCDVANRQVDVIKSVMHAAMGGHVLVAAFAEMHYARVAIQIQRDVRYAGLEPVAKHFTYYLQMVISFVASPRGFTTLVHVPLIDMDSALGVAS
jgi:hypothetical protein